MNLPGITFMLINKVLHRLQNIFYKLYNIIENIECGSDDVGCYYDMIYLYLLDTKHTITEILNYMYLVMRVRSLIA